MWLTSSRSTARIWTTWTAMAHVAQLGAQPVAEQVVVLVPLAGPVEGDEQPVRSAQLPSLARRAGAGEHRIAQRPAQPIQDRGARRRRPSACESERQLGPQVVRHQPVVAGEGSPALSCEPPPGWRKSCEVQRRAILGAVEQTVSAASLMCTCAPCEQVARSGPSSQARRPRPRRHPLTRRARHRQRRSAQSRA